MKQPGLRAVENFSISKKCGKGRPACVLLPCLVLWRYSVELATEGVTVVV
jgi:hypothetical protein